MKKKSNIGVQEATKNRLLNLKSDRETYDELINRLLDESNKLQKAREICAELKSFE